MKVTTVRFGTDLWRMLDVEARRAGVSVSQFVREAALARAAAAIAARGTEPFELLAVANEGGAQPRRARAQQARERAGRALAESEAVRAQSRLAIHHTAELGNAILRKRRSAR
jgi:hypothetical protein